MHLDDHRDLMAQARDDAARDLARAEARHRAEVVRIRTDALRALVDVAANGYAYPAGTDWPEPPEAVQAAAREVLLSCELSDRMTLAFGRAMGALAVALDGVGGQP
jgi:hypothetical protein